MHLRQKVIWFGPTVSVLSETEKRGFRRDYSPENSPETLEISSVIVLQTDTLLVPAMPQLPDNSQLTGITAKFDNGVLIVTVPKTIPKEPEVTDIPINAGDDTSIPPIDV